MTTLEIVFLVIPLASNMLALTLRKLGFQRAADLVDQLSPLALNLGKTVASAKGQPPPMPPLGPTMLALLLVGCTPQQGQQAASAVDAGLSILGAACERKPNLGGSAASAVDFVCRVVDASSMVRRTSADGQPVEDGALVYGPPFEVRVSASEADRFEQEHRAP